MTTSQKIFSNLNLLTSKTFTEGFLTYSFLPVCNIFSFFAFEAIKATKKTTNKVVLVNFN